MALMKDRFAFKMTLFQTRFYTTLFVNSSHIVLSIKLVFVEPVGFGYKLIEITLIE